jgi:transcription elongation factor
MPAIVLQIIVFVVELAAKYGPGLIQVGENLFKAIESNGELSDEEKAELVARVRSTKAAVAAYEPRPHAGSPTADIPDPKPTAR